MMGLPTIIRPCHITKAKAITKLITGQYDKPNLMILEPPRVGKTDLGIKATIPWAHSYFPDSESIITSYAADLAETNSVHIRNTLSSDWYRSITGSDWGCTVVMAGERASGRRDYFHTTEGGSVKAVGVGGGITGFGAGKLREEFGGAIFIDDPMKANDKDSPTIRQGIIDWYHGTLESRKNRKSDPQTPVILIMQRLHVNDLAGHLLQTERHRWNVVQIPAIDDQGNSIWEERISLPELEHMQEYDPDTYWSQYMQEPSQTARAIFKESWWRYWNDITEVEKRITLKIITADTAFKAKDSADFSVLQCWGFEGIAGTYLIDQTKGQWDFPDLVTNTRNFIHKHAQNQIAGITPATEFWIEDKASGTSLIQSLRREGIPAKEWLPDDKTAPDKVARAKQCTMPISAGRVFLPNFKLPGYKWVEHFVNEHSAFTDDDSHLHDDCVDANTMAHLIWMQRGGGRGPIPEWGEYKEAA